MKRHNKRFSAGALVLVHVTALIATPVLVGIFNIVLSLQGHPGLSVLEWVACWMLCYGLIACVARVRLGEESPN